MRPSFTEPFLPGTPRTPDRHTPVAYTIHLAVRRSVLFRQGNNECITTLQWWLLIHILTGKDIDVVDLFICEIDNAIMDGMTVSDSSRSLTRSAGFVLRQMITTTCMSLSIRGHVSRRKFLPALVTVVEAQEASTE
jgi:hypothetical protein